METRAVRTIFRATDLYQFEKLTIRSEFKIQSQESGSIGERSSKTENIATIKWKLSQEEFYGETESLSSYTRPIRKQSK